MFLGPDEPDDLDLPGGNPEVVVSDGVEEVGHRRLVRLGEALGGKQRCSSVLGRRAQLGRVSRAVGKHEKQEATLN